MTAESMPGADCASSTILRVPLGARAYDIEIGSGNLARLGEFLQARWNASHVAVITDSHVRQLLAPRVQQALAGKPVHVLEVPAGEPSKCVVQAERLWEQLLALGADRKTAVVALGGGVVGDLAGFIAATYARGLAFFQVPTTLLAQVDSSVGGKVGINLPGAKNIVGCFWQPRGVLIDTAVLATLPEREYRAGLAEVVKYGVILDEEFFCWLEAHISELNRREAAALRHAITRSCQLKADVVARDEREETGLRAVLNYGHTFCHALEALTGYAQLLHGEGVAIGMLCASRLAEKLGRIDGSITRRQRALLTALGLPTRVPALDRQAILEAMAHDKKAEHGKLRFVLPTRLGRVELVSDVPREHVLAALEE